MKLNIHLLPGLGFDRRVFGNLILPEANIYHLEWQGPRHREHFEDYAFRVSDYMEKLDGRNILIGHSLGGILSQEIANVRAIEKVVLISSIRSRKELPGFFKIVGWLGLHPLFSKKTTYATFPFWARSQGYETKEKRELFKSMIGKQSDKYLKWALKCLSIWEGVQNLKTPVIQIHGDRDHTFPVKLLDKPDYIIKGGTHMMAYDRAEEISEIIFTEIK